DIKQEIIKRISSIKSDRAVEILETQLLKEEDSDTRVKIISGLVSINNDKAAEVVGAQLSREQNKAVKEAIINILKYLQINKALGILETQLLKEEENEFKFQILLKLKEIITGLRDPESKWKKDAINIEKTAEVLGKKLLEEQDSWIKQEITEILEIIIREFHPQKIDKAAEALAAQFSREQEILIKQIILRALSFGANENAIESLGKNLLEEKDKNLKLDLIRVLSGYTKSEKAAEALGAQLSQEQDIEVKSKIIESLGNINSDKAAEALAAQLSQEQDKEVKSMIIIALDNINSDKAAEILATQLKKEADISIKLVIINILVHIRSKNSVEPLIEKMKEEKDDSVKTAIIQALDSIRSEKAVEPLIEQLKDNSNSDQVRIASANVLSHLNSDKSVDVFIKESKDKTNSDLVRVASLKPLVDAVGRVSSEDVIDLLIEQFKDKTNGDKVRVESAYRLSLTKNERLIELIEHLKDKTNSDEVRMALITALEQTKEIKLEQVRGEMITQLKDKGNSDAVRIKILGSFGVIIGGKSIDPLLEQLKDKTNSDAIRIKIISILGALESKKAVEPLIGQLKDKDNNNDIKKKVVESLTKFKPSLLAKKLGINIKLANYLISSQTNLDAFAKFTRILDEDFKRNVNEIAYNLAREKTLHPSEHHIEEDEKYSLFDHLFTVFSEIDKIKSEQELFNKFFRNDPKEFNVDIPALVELFSYLSIDETIKIIKLIRDDPKLTMSQIMEDIKKEVRTMHPDINEGDFEHLIKRLDWLVRNLFIIEQQLQTLNDFITTDETKIKNTKDLIELLKAIDDIKPVDDKTGAFGEMHKLAVKYSISIEAILQFKVDSIGYLDQERLIISTFKEIDEYYDELKKESKVKKESGTETEGTGAGTETESTIKEDAINEEKSTVQSFVQRQFEFLPEQSRRRVYLYLLFNSDVATLSRTDNEFVMSQIEKLSRAEDTKKGKEAETVKEAGKVKAVDGVETVKPVKEVKIYPAQPQINEFLQKNRKILQEFTVFNSITANLPGETKLKKEWFKQARKIIAREKYKKTKDVNADAQLGSLEAEFKLPEVSTVQIPHLFFEHILKNTFNVETMAYDEEAIELFRKLITQVKVVNTRNNFRTNLLVWNQKTYDKRSDVFISLIKIIAKKNNNFENMNSDTGLTAFVELNKRIQEFEEVMDTYEKASKQEYKDYEGNLLPENDQMLKLTTNLLENIIKKQEIDDAALRQVLEIKGRLKVVDLLAKFKSSGMVIENEEGVSLKLAKFTLTDKFKNKRDYNNKDIYTLIQHYLSVHVDNLHFSKVMLDALLHYIDGNFETWKFESEDYVLTLNEIIALEISKLPEEEQAKFKELKGESNLEKLANAESTESAKGVEGIKGLNPESLNNLRHIRQKIEKIRNWEKASAYGISINGEEFTVEYLTNFFDLFNIGNYPGTTACQSCVYGNNLNAGLLGYVNNGANGAIVILDENRFVVTRRIARLRIVEDSNGNKFPAIYVEESTQFGSKGLDQLHEMLKVLSINTGLPVVSSIKRQTQPKTFKVYQYKGRSLYDYSDTQQPGGVIKQEEYVVQRIATASIDNVPDKTIEDVAAEAGFKKIEVEGGEQPATSTEEAQLLPESVEISKPKTVETRFDLKMGVFTSKDSIDDIIAAEESTEIHMVRVDNPSADQVSKLTAQGYFYRPAKIRYTLNVPQLQNEQQEARTIDEAMDEYYSQFTSKQRRTFKTDVSKMDGTIASGELELNVADTPTDSNIADFKGFLELYQKEIGGRERGRMPLIDAVETAGSELAFMNTHKAMYIKKNGKVIGGIIIGKSGGAYSVSYASTDSQERKQYRNMQFYLVQRMIRRSIEEKKTILNYGIDTNLYGHHLSTGLMQSKLNAGFTPSSVDKNKELMKITNFDVFDMPTFFYNYNANGELASTLIITEYQVSQIPNFEGVTPEMKIFVLKDNKLTPYTPTTPAVQPAPTTQAEPTLTQLTPSQLDTLVRDGITVTQNPDGTTTLSVHIKIALTDEQMKAIDKAVNSYIDDYESLVYKIKKIITGKGKFKCKVGSCVGDAVLPEAAPETAKVERDITTRVIETAKKSAGPKYVQPKTVSKSNTPDKTVEPSGLYNYCLDNKYKCSGVAGIFGIALVLLIMLITYGIANYMFKKGDNKTKGENIQETEDEAVGIDYSGLPYPSDLTEETQEVPMSEEEELNYYFNCFENTPEEFADEGESISGDVYTVSSYLPTMVFTDGYLQQRAKICSGRIDSYLKYLSNQGFEVFLNSNLKMYSMLDDNQKGYLIEGLFRLGNGDAALVLLSFPLPSKEPSYGTYNANYFVFDYAQKIINKGELDKETALEYYTPLFYDNPNGKGLKFILDNLSPDERKAFIRELVMSDDPRIKKQFVEYKSQYNTEYTLPKELLEEMYTKTTDPLLKASLLDKMGVKEIPTKLMKELDVLYETSDFGARKEMIEMITDLANSDETDEAKSDPYNVFIIDKFKESSDANDLVVLGDVLDYNQLLGLYKKDPNFKKYLIAKAKQSGNINEPFKFWFREFIDSCVSDVECTVMIKTEEVWCTKGC
ncbi:HEAT repeat domain-containing protein, partial [Candidatus Woesearchaeota archaeon]|nr:HEAT repeat domain-containing protein [Candidatus Woesearchaeota archaeon]